MTYLRVVELVLAEDDGHHGLHHLVRADHVTKREEVPPAVVDAVAVVVRAGGVTALAYQAV